MAKTKYKVYDATGTWLRTFDTYREAQTYRAGMGRPDWQIIPVVIR